MLEEKVTRGTGCLQPIPETLSEWNASR
jgi:hypothetical protein